MKTAHNVTLLNGSKQEVNYTGVETVTMPGTDGQDKVFTAGTPIDALDISLDFSSGDMPLEAPKGYVVRGATIKKPKGVEQIVAKGVTAAGIVGEYVTPGTAKEIILDFSAGSEKDYLPQLTGTTALDNTYGYFIRVKGGTLLTVGDTYLVSWDGTAYTCIAQDASILMDGAVCLGNATALGLSGNDEPFCAAYLQGGFSVVSLTDTEPTEHTVRIYQVSEDQTVTAEGDERWSSVTVRKPEGLVPENIASGIEIAGVAGEMSAITVQDVAERKISGMLFDESVQFVDSYAFANCGSLEEVSFPVCSSVGVAAFSHCISLRSVSIPLVSSVNTYTFYGCSALETATIGCNSNFYTYARSNVFSNCTSLRNINFMYSGSSVDGKFAFDDMYGSNQFQFAQCSSLESIHIIGKGTDIGGTGATATTIPGYAFSGCTLLSDFKFSGKLGAYRTQQSEISKYFEIGAYAFHSCGNLSYLSLSISGGTGIGIGSYAFAYCSKLQDLWLNFGSFTSSGSTWAWLGDSAFYGTPIASSGLTGKFGSIHIAKNAYPYLRIASGWKAYSARMVSY